MRIRMALPEEYASVRAFYHDLIDRMRGSEGFPGWEKEIHPSDAVLRAALNARTMYLGELARGEERTGSGTVHFVGRAAPSPEWETVAAMVLNHERGQGYEEAVWQTDAPDTEVYVLHILAVRPDLQGRGIAARMLEGARSIAAERGMKAIRLDVMQGNTPAERLYERHGFVCVHTRTSVYFTAGEITARLMERLIAKEDACSR